MKAFACIVAIAFLAGFAQPAFSQETPPQEPPAPEEPLLIAPESQPEPPLQIVPEAPLEAAPEPATQAPETPSEELPVLAPAPAPPVYAVEPPRTPLPDEASHPLYIAGAVLYPVGWLIEQGVVRPILFVFSHRFDEDSMACPAPVLTPSPQNAARLTPPSGEPGTPPRYNYQPRR